jgi:hypothetical protein
MIHPLRRLSEEEKEQLFEIPALITLLIAGADNNIQREEITWASAVVNYRTITGDELLFTYYDEVNVRFDPAVDSLLEKCPTGLNERTVYLEKELKKVNPVLSKLDKLFKDSLVKSWRSLAKQVARATGGILGVGAISSQEEELIGLHFFDEA